MFLGFGTCSQALGRSSRIRQKINSVPTESESLYNVWCAVGNDLGKAMAYYEEVEENGQTIRRD